MSQTNSDKAAFEIPNMIGMSMSYVEILKDEVYDLMSEKQAVSLDFLDPIR
jgi:hypothetical protein